MDTLQALGEDLPRKPHCESPTSVFCLGVKKPQEATCDEAKTLRAVAFSKDDQRRVPYLLRFNENLAW